VTCEETAPAERYSERGGAGDETIAELERGVFQRYLKRRVRVG